MNKFGFDDAFNYKEEPDLDAALKRSEVVDFKCHYQALIHYIPLGH